MKGVRILLVLLIGLVAVGIAVSEANLNTKPEGIIEIGKTNNMKIKGLLEKALEDNKLTPVELKMLYDAGAKILAAESEIGVNHLKKLHKDYDLIIPGYMASELDALISREYSKQPSFEKEGIPRQGWNACTTAGCLLGGSEEEEQPSCGTNTPGCSRSRAL